MIHELIVVSVVKVLLTSEQKLWVAGFTCELFGPLFNSCLSINKDFTHRGELVRSMCMLLCLACVAAHFSCNNHESRGTVKTPVTDDDGP